MRLISTTIYKGILHITTRILKDYFFYDEEALGRFLNLFTEKVGTEYSRLNSESNQELLDFLEYDPIGKKQFTSYFVSLHLHDVLVDDFFFSDEELKMFDNILPKYIGVPDIYADKRDKRAHY